MPSLHKLNDITVGQDGRYVLALTVEHDGDIDLVTDLPPCCVARVLAELAREIIDVARGNCGAQWPH